MISTTEFELHEKLTEEELSSTINLTKKMFDLMPKHYQDIQGNIEKIKSEYFIDNDNIFINSNEDISIGEKFIFNNTIGEFEIKHFNLSYSFIINSFLLLLKHLNPNKVTLHKSDQNWENNLLFLYQITKNSNLPFYDLEYIEKDGNVTLHISYNNNDKIYKDKLNNQEDYQLEMSSQYTH